MNLSRNQFFPDASGTAHQYRGIRRSHTFEVLEQFARDSAATD